MTLPTSSTGIDRWPLAASGEFTVATITDVVLANHPGSRPNCCAILALVVDLAVTIGLATHRPVPRRRVLDRVANALRKPVDGV